MQGTELLISLFGPLAGLECRRALVRGWVFIVRALATLPAALVLTIVVWCWWFLSPLKLGYSPIRPPQIGLMVLEDMLITAGLILAPALLAGSLAGERARNTLGLLLACLVSPREIVTGRLAGRLSVVAFFLLAAVPAMFLLSSFLTLPASVLGTLLLLPVAICFGSGGLAVAASAVARRGRDALMAAYLIDLLFLLAPMFGSQIPTGTREWFEPIFPYHGVNVLIENADPGPALLTASLWCLWGLAGSAFAVWRLRPAFLSEVGKKSSRRALFARRRMPPASDNPVLWKELYIEQLRSFNRFVRWLGVLIVAAFTVTTLALAGICFWWTFVRPDTSEASWAETRLGLWMRGAPTIGLLLQWVMGLRAAVAVASERERGTWEGLILSPLDGREIVVAKIYGSLYSLRWFAAAIIFAWTVAVFSGALDVVQYVELVAGTLILSFFMVAAGVYFSLYCSTATRAMTLTLIAWMGTYVATMILAGLLIGVIGLAFLILEMLLAGPLVSGTAFGGASSLFSIGYNAIFLLCYFLYALLLAAYCRRNFDRLAGRAFGARPVKKKRRRTKIPEAVAIEAVPKEGSGG